MVASESGDVRLQKKIDPGNGEAYTWEEMHRYYASTGRFSEAEIKAFWDGECQPMQTVMVEMIRDSFEVEVPVDGSVADLFRACGKHENVSSFFRLLREDGNELDDPSALLQGCAKASTKVTLIKENASQLCPAAQQVLKQFITGEFKADPAFEESSLRLGRCRKLGEFASSQWKEDPRMPMDLKDYTHMLGGIDAYLDRRGKNHVLDLTLIDGMNQQVRLIAIINEGDNGGHIKDSEGFWGSVYLRPSFQEVAGLISDPFGSTWDIIDDTWYTPPSEMAPCNVAHCGGKPAQSPLETHLSTAVAFAMEFAVQM
eukprot:gnl/MRDRNA2_/MRDRNA2_97008_c0_seq1.p1 gnl/MRDRNA2_/MRDRNA2_97008_c0~~gnl/MRDRNA2_/MRDRNA2_97008_c0_seq1.p1  ORF type:complete len:345 (+),score=71.40 gnl/MRDRNA2_/MRDRNA2_97008_c0_seq1:95-1036(+)